MSSTGKLLEEFERFKSQLDNKEKEMQAHTERFPTKNVKNTGSNTVKNRPWNYGATKCSMSKPVAQNEMLRPLSSPICTRSRSRSRSRTVSPPTRLLPKTALSNPSKNVVHKQTINAGDKKTIVEVSVKTMHQSRKASLHPALTDDYLVGKFSNMGISSQDSKKCDSSSCINPCLTSEVKKEPSWSNILSQNPSQLTMLNGISNTRSCDVTTDPRKKRRLYCHPNHGTPPLDSQKSSEVWPKEAHLKLNGEGNIPISVDPHRKLNFLIKELRGNSLNDPNLQRIVLDMEEALANLPSENLGSHVMSSKINGAQSSVQSQCNSPPTKLPSMVSQSHGLDCGDPMTEPSLLRLSPNPLSSEQHLPQRKACAPREDWGSLIQNFLDILSAVPKSTSPPEGKHRTKKNHVKDDRPKFFKEQLEEACRTLEKSCKRMEDDCEQLKKDKAELEKTLRDKERELQSALSVTQELKAQHDEMQLDLRRTSKELQKIREEQATQRRSHEHEENIKIYQRRIDELLAENKKQAIELSLSRLEKEKLSVMLYNAGQEREKLIQEINGKQINCFEKMVEKRTKKMKACSTSDEEEVKSAHRKEKPRVTSQRVLRSDRRNITESHEEEIATNSGKEEKVSNLEKDEKLRSPDTEVEILTELKNSSCYFFHPVNRDWQTKASKALGLVVKRPLIRSSKREPLGKPEACIDIGTDGNCFFRCISLYLTGDEDMHEVIRGAVVKYMKENSSEFEEGNDEEYIQNMETLTTWATEVELRATAKLLNTPIYTYMKYNASDWKWQRFGPGRDLTDCDDSAGALYLRNTWSCHYDVVRAVSCNESELS